MKRNWTVIAALIGILIAYEVYVLGPYNKKQAEQKQQQAVSSKAQTVKENPGGANNLETSPSPVVQKSSAQEVTSTFKTVDELSLGKERSVSLLSNGGLRNAKFVDYFKRGKDEKVPVEILDDGLFWGSSNPDLQSCLGKLQYKGQLEFFAKAGTVECVLAYKQSSVDPGLYSASLTVRGLKNYQGNIFVEIVSHLGTEDRFDFKALDFKIDGEKENIKGEGVFETKAFKGKIDWASWGDQYFTTIFFPKGSFNPDLALSTIDGADKDKKERRFRILYQYPLIDLGKNEMVFESDLYIGTKDLTVLKKIKPELAEVVDLGWFSSVGRFMLWCLEQLNKFLHNFGWSIIVLTVLVRLVFWPLNRKVFDSGQKMKDLQPKIEALRTKYGKDRSQVEQLNREMMALYRNEKVNPMGSCLPLLLQMPIFIGLYGALSHSIDLYQAPFILWIEDLSFKDPYYVLPILWTVSLLLMMKYTPQPTMNQPGMPDMKKVMFVMYFVFGFMAKDWPSGLCLYLVVSSFLGTFQQMLFRRAQAKLQPLQEGA